jgi:hypothetical protein
MSSTKKRTREDLIDDDHASEMEQDVTLKSPSAKKRNTMPSPISTTTSSQDISTAMPASTATTTLVSSHGGSKCPPTVDEREEFIDCNKSSNSRPTLGDKHDYLDDNPPPLPGPLASSPHNTPFTVEAVNYNFAREEGDVDDAVYAKSASFDNNEYSSKSVSVVQSKPHSFVYRPSLRESSLLLVTAGIVFFAIYLVLWMTVSMYDLTDHTLEIHHCRQSRSLLSTTTIGANNVRNNYDNQLFLDNTIPQEEFYQKELEKQVQYWKRRAKQNEFFANGYKDEYQARLKQLEGD